MSGWVSGEGCVSVHMCACVCAWASVNAPTCLPACTDVSCVCVHACRSLAPSLSRSLAPSLTRPSLALPLHLFLYLCPLPSFCSKHARARERERQSDRETARSEEAGNQARALTHRQARALTHRTSTNASTNAPHIRRKREHLSLARLVLLRRIRRLLHHRPPHTTCPPAPPAARARLPACRAGGWQR